MNGTGTPERTLASASGTLVEDLEQALDDFGGALVVVSHDRALRRRFRGAELEISEGRIC